MDEEVSAVSGSTLWNPLPPTRGSHCALAFLKTVPFCTAYIIHYRSTYVTVYAVARTQLLTYLLTYLCDFVYSRANLRECLERLRNTMPVSAVHKTTTLQLLKGAKLHIAVSYIIFILSSSSSSSSSSSVLLIM